jgi:hypothetical protein
MGVREVHAEGAGGHAKAVCQGFDIYFEDRYEYLCWRAFKLSSMGLRAPALEVALTNLLENDVVGGKEYAQTDKGRSLIYKLAHNRSLKPGNGSWFYKTKEKRPRTPVTGRRIVIKAKPQTCVEAMAEIIKAMRFSSGLAVRDDRFVEDSS